jgi:hypothetical protein
MHILYTVQRAVTSTVHTVSSVISKNYKLHYPFQLSCLILWSCLTGTLNHKYYKSHHYAAGGHMSHRFQQQYQSCPPHQSSGGSQAPLATDTSERVVKWKPTINNKLFHKAKYMRYFISGCRIQSGKWKELDACGGISKRIDISNER